MFPTDLPDQYNGNYVYGDCLVKCKLKSVVALCNCKPFHSPMDFPDLQMSSLPFCSLTHLQCLNKYRIKWMIYRPREMIDGLEQEMEDSLSCGECYPLCSSSTLNIDSTSAQLNFFYDNKGSIM